MFLKIDRTKNIMHGQVTDDCDINYKDSFCLFPFPRSANTSSVV
jgi:hypothetical protein